MKTFIAHFACFAFLLQTLIFPIPAFADEEVATVREGEPAPFTGTLFSTEATARMLADLELSRESCDLRIGQAVERKEAELQLNIDQLQIRLDSNSEIFNQRLSIRDGQIDFLQQQIQPPRWYQHPALWISVGLIVGAGATIGVTYAVNTP